MLRITLISSAAWKPLAVRSMLLAASLLLASAAAVGTEVDYYPGSGLLELNNTGTSLGGVTVYLTLPSLPSNASLAVLTGSDSAPWSSNSTPGAGSTTCGEIFWTGNIGTLADALPQGLFTLTTLPTNLNSSNFGYSYTGGRGQTYNKSPNDTTGAVSFEDIQSGAATPDIVYIKRSVPLQNTWSGNVSWSWNTPSNWAQSSSASETATFSSLTPSGTVTLDGNQSAGALWFDSSSPYTIAAGSGGTLTLGNSASIWVDAGSHTIAAPLSLAGSLTVDTEAVNDVGTSLTVSGPISGASALIKTGPGILYLNNPNNTYNSNTSISGGTLSAAGGGSLGASGSLSISSATLDFSGPGTFARGISLSGSGANTIQADAGVMTLSGAISGSGGLTKTGIGTLAVSNSSNSYKGGTNVLAGTLQIQAAAALSSTSAVTVAGGAALDLNGFSPALANVSGGGAVTNNKLSTTSTLSAAYVGGAASYAAAIQDGAGKVAMYVPSGGALVLGNTANNYSGGTTVSGTLSVSADGNLGSSGGSISLNNGVLQAASGFALNSGRAITLLGNPGFDVAAGQTLAFGGVVGGTGSLTKTNDGTLLLTGPNNTFSGGVSISGGNLAVAGDASLGDSAGTVTINSGALEFTTSTISAHTLNLANVNSYVQIDSGMVTHAGLITGPGVLVKSGPGTLAVTNTANDYGGGTVVAGGVLLDNDPTALALGKGTSAILVQSGGQLSGTGTVSQPVNCSAGGNVAPGQGSTIGTLSLQQGLALGNASSVTLKLGNQSGNPVSDCIDFEPDPNTAVTFAGLTLSGTFTTYLTGTPVPLTGTPYTLFDHVRTSGGGAPSRPSNLSFVLPPGYTAQWSVSGPIQDYSNLNLTDYYQIYANVAGPTEWQSTGGSGAWSNGNNWTQGEPFGDGNSRQGSPVMFGTLGSGTVSLPADGSSCATVLIFNNSNSYTVSAPSGGTLSLVDVDGRGVNAGSSIVEVVSGSHSITARVALDAPTNITMFDAATALTITGAVSGTGSLTLAGSGSLILAGDDSFSGGTTVNGGVLYLTSNKSLPSGSSLSVGAGGTLIFDPSIAASPAGLGSAGEPVSSASTVSPVPEPGTLATLAVGAFCCIAVGSWRRWRVGARPENV